MGGCVGEWTKTKLMLISTQVEVVVEVEVELGNVHTNNKIDLGCNLINKSSFY